MGEQRLKIQESQEIAAAPVLTDRYGRNTLTFSEWRDVKPQEAFETSLADHLIVIHTTPNAVKVHDRADALILDGLARPGDINVLSAGEMSFCRWESDLSFYRLELTPAFMESVAKHSELPYHDKIDLNHRFRTRDDKIQQIAEWLKQELQNGGLGGKLYFDSLANLLALHLLQGHSIGNGKPHAGPASMTERQVAKAIDYMEAHFHEEVSLETLSQATNISSAHLVRLFKQATGTTPHQYLIGLRVKHAQKLLLNPNYTISDAAMQAGFTDQSHLHRHFKRLIGCTPREYILRR